MFVTFRVAPLRVLSYDIDFLGGISFMCLFQDSEHFVVVVQQYKWKLSKDIGSLSQCFVLPMYVPRVVCNGHS